MFSIVGFIVPSLKIAKNNLAKSFLTSYEPNSPLPSLSTQVSRFKPSILFVAFTKHMRHLSLGVSLESGMAHPSYRPLSIRLQ